MMNILLLRWQLVLGANHDKKQFLIAAHKNITLPRALETPPDTLTYEAQPWMGNDKIEQSAK